MIFIYKKWEKLCSDLAAENRFSITAQEVLEKKQHFPYIILKHDVETNVARAYDIAKIEREYGHRGTYYVQAYLLETVKNVSMLKDMAQMGHEITYHYDVMDSCKGNLDEAIVEYEQNIAAFVQNGFCVKTVCQHGNPIVERVGYTSNRDFFRNARVQAMFPQMADVMVNFKQKAETDYLYFSDAGRRFKMIYDPINNDIINSDEKNIPFENLEKLCQYANNSGCSYIISMHPHRWTSSLWKYALKDGCFRVVRGIAKFLSRIPFVKKIMSKYYYLAKKI